MPPTPDTPAGPSFHHIGYVVRDVRAHADQFGAPLGLSWDGEVFHDPIQRVEVTFLRPSGGPHDPAIELVAPAADDSPVNGFLESGGGLHHVCYEVDDLESHVAQCRAHGVLPISTPAPAVAFGGRRIVWAYTRERLLVEFLERTIPGESP